MSPRIVVIGAGVVGAAVADELVARGWTDVTVVDQGMLPVPGGSSSHAPGLIFQTNPSKTMAGFARYTVEKFAELDSLLPLGGLEVATTPERLADLRRRHGWATSWGIPSRLVDPEECARLHPLVDPARVLGGYHTPTDGLARAKQAVGAQLDRAAEGGARLAGRHRVLDILQHGGRVTGVRTDRGDLPADIVVSATGFWGPDTGKMTGLRIPLLPMAHQYAKTTPLRALDGHAVEASSPILRHQDRDLYFREHHDRIGIGSYAHRPMPVDLADLPEGDMPSVLDFTMEDFAPSWDDARALLPALEGTEVAEGINGIFSFTPDAMPLMGEHPGLRGFWIAEAVWVTHSAGVGRAMADWLVDGDPGVDVHGCDLARFDDVQRTDDHVRARSSQNFVEVYDVVHPLDPPSVHRPLRVSPFHARQVALGAVFTEIGGWERPLWFEANAGLAEVGDIPGRSEWASRNWSPIAGAEALVTRDRVALYDMTPLKRLDVTGPGALALLQRLTTNDVDRSVGSITYTLLLEHSGGIRSDLTVARLAEDHFRVGANGELDLDRLRREAGRQPVGEGDVTITDVTAGTCGIGLWGPSARDVLERLTDDDVSHEGFGFYRAERITVAGVPVLAMRLSYVGELGWELYTTADLGLRLWDALWEAGADLGIIAAGRRAFDSLRLEKGYRSAGTDVTTEHDPYEAGLAFAVRAEKGDFVGRAALAARELAARRLVPLLLEEPTDVVMGSEPVFRDGEAVGYVTSAAYGPSVRASIAYAWLPTAVAEPATRVEIEYFGERLSAVVATEPLFDPEMKRMRT
ncbi:MAG: FAD-dependent oxidoreductase [Actinomycetota bacterium]|nr:FAD-dependent oxidoreductase [Actinomycetota bacterium]